MSGPFQGLNPNFCLTHEGVLQVGTNQVRSLALAQLAKNLPHDACDLPLFVHQQWSSMESNLPKLDFLGLNAAQTQNSRQVRYIIKQLNFALLVEFVLTTIPPSGDR